MSNPALLLVSVVSQAGQYWTFQAVLASWKLFKSHLTSPYWPELSIHSIGKVKLKRTRIYFPFRHFLREEECSLFILGEAISEVSTLLSPSHLLMSHRNSLVRTEKSFGSDLGE